MRIYTHAGYDIQRDLTSMFEDWGYNIIWMLPLCGIYLHGVRKKQIEYMLEIHMKSYETPKAPLTLSATSAWKDIHVLNGCIENSLNFC